MPDYAEQISLALSGDETAMAALFSDTVASVYYSSLKITGAAYPAHLVTVRTYLLAFRSLSRLAYPTAFPVWLERLSVYLAYHAAADRYSGAELGAAREQLIAFLRDFHHMSDAEIASLLALSEEAVAECTMPPEALNADEFLIDKEAVLGIWRDICSRSVTPPSGAAPAAETTAAPAAAPKYTDLRQSAEYRKKRARRRTLRIGLASLALLLIALAVFAALRARNRAGPTRRSRSWPTRFRSSSPDRLARSTRSPTTRISSPSISVTAA